MEFLTVALAIMATCLLVEGVAIVEIMRQVGQIREIAPRQGAMITAGEGLADRDVVPDLSSRTTIAGSPPLSADRPNVLFFLTTDCALCRDIAKTWDDFDVEAHTRAKRVAVIRGSPPLVRAFIAELNVPRTATIVDEDGALARVFKIHTYPSVVIVDEAGRKRAHGLVNTTGQAAALLDRVVTATLTA